MDFDLFLAVLWRSRRLLLGGLGLGVVLAVLAYAQPGFSGGMPTLKPRGSEVWQSESQLLIAQAGFPYRQAPEAGEPARSVGALSPIYANLANSGVVQAEIHKQLGTTGTVKAAEDVDLAAASFLPFVNFTATAPTKEQATKLARGAASIFEAYVAHEQELNGVPQDKRIQLTAVQSGVNTKLSEGHKLSIPLLVFFVVLIATVSLIFLKENLKPRVAAKLASLQEAETNASASSAKSGLAAREPALTDVSLADAGLTDAALTVHDTYASAHSGGRVDEGATVHRGEPIASGASGAGRRW
jgi:capsular polysaccharide biosynthesis protein